MGTFSVPSDNPDLIPYIKAKLVFAVFVLIDSFSRPLAFVKAQSDYV